MYTWGYLKNAILAKLDMDEEEALQMNYFERFIIYANEAMTMICSTVKPKRTFYQFEGKYGDTITMPSDFISFGDDVNTINEDIGYGDRMIRKTCDEDFQYVGYNQIRCFSEGIYNVSYNARWHKFTIDENSELEVPIDILECIPTYVASQCMKVDDEQKAAMLRNEFEILFARIDDTNYKLNKTFTIGGDW